MLNIPAGELIIPGILTVSNSTFVENSAGIGGGIHTRDTNASISNSTFYFNYADDGGAIFADGDTVYHQLQIVNSTFVRNIANNGGAIYRSGGVTEIFNSIFTDSPGGANCWGVILDGGHNIDSGDSCSFEIANASMINTDPLLGPLQDNGGDTWTHAVLDGNPAIDAANSLFCPFTDQRNVPRPQDGDNDGMAICDIGSYEKLTPTILDTVTINGSTMGAMGIEYPFVATVAPLSATTPITYTWQASEQLPFTITGALSNTVTFSWATTGTKTLTVTATNLVGSVTGTHTITIEPLKLFYLPMIFKNQAISEPPPPDSQGATVRPILLPPFAWLLPISWVGVRRLQKRTR